ncbi:TM2 domain-containing protein [Chryseobacterium shandongense]|jgi:TM2 domain-containing membrane protein YozV|uniref:TM2 domain-containing protein n=1 Tax=Chryseobacterium shandongense TaxID=1493872 RepID=A0A3G6Q7S8_9FLAO|nr:MULTISPECIES: TM2 domain-containing protein [Chryseobacterium]AZA57385.1 TM2 domain-containing protein [Chryseobacterium shandongense]AZA85633.1 TM2 domain-containing protein [Chryseobacterium shandongense]AZA97806.1 TM2 domain-containing protein [Chryseobacterium shandongense]
MEVYENQGGTYNQPYRSEKKVTAGILAILLGGLAIHKFYLGYTKTGIIQLILSLVTCGTVGGLIGLIEGIIYLTKSDEEFDRTYVQNQKEWF